MATSPIISASQTSIVNSTQTTTNANNAVFNVFNAGEDNLVFSISSNQTWIIVNPTLGSLTALPTALSGITVSFDTSALAINSYTGSIVISAVSATNTPFTIPVSLLILPTGIPNIPAGFDSSWTAVDPYSPTSESKWVRHIRLNAEDIK